MSQPTTDREPPATTTIHDPATGESRSLEPAAEAAIATTTAPGAGAPRRFGTFLGVYTPSVLTILGLIMYLRFGWVVGNAGLALTVVIVLLASSITFITALSASAVATNMRVGVGGEYYMIAHSLGLELGGAIGIPLFLCRTLSITFYSFGLAESLLSLWPASWGAVPEHGVQILAALTIVVITAVAGRSAELALKMQIPILMVVGLSLVALAVGALWGGVHAPRWGGDFTTAPAGFWYVFAVFFPAVTGFTAGIGMSGDLENPQRSIPRGTLAAVASGTAVYLVVPALIGIAAAVGPEVLLQPGVEVWLAVAVGGGLLVYPGMWGAILSSGIGSVLGGPRVLQALAADGLAPKPLSRLSRSGQPTLATWISGGIALAAVALGGLNAVAQFVTILFLTLYVTINLAAAVEKLVRDPSYRPTINVPWAVSLAGAAGAIIVMFLISPAACVAAVVLEGVLYAFLRRQALRKRWGDVRAGLWVTLARYALLRLRRHRSDPRNWRPHILLFVGDPAKRIGLVRLAAWFNQNRGVVTACNLVVGDLQRQAFDIDGLRTEMERSLGREELVAFAEVDVVSDFEQGVIDVAQANGIAGLQSNTVMFGWPEKRSRLEARLRIMRALSRAGKNTVIARLNWAHEPGQTKRIDLWWGGLENNGDLMLLLAYLLSLNNEWLDAQIVVRSIVDREEQKDTMEASLDRLIPAARIRASSEILVKRDGEDIADILHRHSRDADVVFLGLQDPEPGTEPQYADRLIELAAGLRTTIFVRNAGEFAGNLI